MRHRLGFALVFVTAVAGCDTFVSSQGGDGEACFDDGTCNDGYRCLVEEEICVERILYLVAQITLTTMEPTDIIFVIDNSGSMVDEIVELRRNLGSLFEALSQGANEYRVGFVTPDVECNVPERVCPSLPDGTSQSCCSRVQAESLPDCVEGDRDGDTVLDYSNCDGGRFRTADAVAPDGTTVVGEQRWLDRPDDADLDDWLDGLQAAVGELGCHGSGYEAGLEAVRRAVVCSLSEAQREARGLRQDDGVVTDACPDDNVAQLNAGFLRDEADLVIIFVTDEDDCSFYDDTEPYRALTNNLDEIQQATKLCSPTECYAYHGEDLDTGGTSGLMDWADRNSSPRMDCGNVKRMVNPPMPSSVATFLDDLQAAKGGAVEKIRIGGIVGGREDVSSGNTGFRSGACFFDPLRADGGTSDPGPSLDCGCWSTGTSLFCDITDATGGQLAPWPLGQAYQACTGGEQVADGCQAMMGGRYVDLAELLAQRRIEAGQEPGVLLSSICQFDYAAFFAETTGAVILSTCVDVGVELPDHPDDWEVELNGQVVPYASEGSGLQSWTSGVASATEICFQNLGGLRPGDAIEVYDVTQLVD